MTRIGSGTRWRADSPRVTLTWSARTGAAEILVRARPPAREHGQVNRAAETSAADDQSPETVVLWRPTGPEELALVEASGWRAWPPRLPEQPIFYPVLNEEYATMIARDWNVPQSGAGFVTRFAVRKAFLDMYEVHQVGGQTILEYWIPAEDLATMNANIVGLIEVTTEFHEAGRRHVGGHQAGCGMGDVPPG